jgi:radical SAM superfamily enzyme YgiQ (UPF0313 family)
MGEKIRANIEGEPPHFVLGEGKRCPFLDEDGLCEIIREHGDGALCDICYLHPRFSNEYDTFTETGLGFCCEEAAKIILSFKGKIEPVLISDDGEREELDFVYSLPYARNYHPDYEAMGGVPAITEVKFSLTHNRGCFGGCNFCALAFHQGREVRSRSEESVLAEARKIVAMDDFKGYINDVGGPTANFRYPSCEKQKTSGVCPNKKCLSPTPCKNLVVDHTEYARMLGKIEAIDGVKKVFVRSGIRFDYLLYDKSDAFFRQLVERHTSVQLKVAP